MAFRGRGYEYAIDLPGLGRLTGVFARHRAERGDEVGMRLYPEGCHVFPAEAAAATLDGLGSAVVSEPPGERGTGATSRGASVAAARPG